MRQFSEEWRDIPSVTSQVHGVCYQASSLGNIRRATLTEPRKFGKCLKPWIDREGYAYVYPCIKFKLYTNTVHKLVAEAFLGPCPEGLEVNHKDTNKLN